MIGPKSASLSGSEAPKSRWEMVLTSTPVILSVLATFLAGQSTAEMTRAQYYRALASQNQSKVADQWAFFQAKRIRGTSLQMASELLNSLQLPGHLDPGALLQSLEDLVRQENAVLQGARKLAKEESAADSAARIQALSEKVQKRIQEQLPETAALLKDIQAWSANTAGAEHYRALSALVGLEDVARKNGESSNGNSGHSDPQGKDLQQAIKAIQDREAESKIKEIVRPISEEAIQHALTRAEEKAEAKARRAKETERQLQSWDRRVDQLVYFARAMNRLTLEARLLAEEEKNGANKALLQLARNMEVLKTMVSDLQAGYRSARFTMTAKRYDMEGNDNQIAAYLYEVRVAKASDRSDYHLLRSRNFFYGMLAAQFAVMISTLSLAVRQKSLLWGMATLAGLGALVFTGYVYLAI